MTTVTSSPGPSSSDMPDCEQRVPETPPLALAMRADSITVHSAKSVVNATLDRVQDTILGRISLTRTGIHDIDSMLLSFRPGALHILAGRPGVGKSSLALKITQEVFHSEDQGGGVLFFSLETNRHDLMLRLLSAESRVPCREIETGMLDTSEMEALAAASASIQQWQLELVDTCGLTIHALVAVVADRLKSAQKPFKLVIIDSLLLLSPTRPDMTEDENLSEISRTLKVMARTNNLPVLALSQVNRATERGVGTVPREHRLSDLRGSGTIEQDVDAVIFLQSVDRSDDERKSIKIILAKNRFGPSGYAFLNFYPKTMRFEVATEHEAVASYHRAKAVSTSLVPAAEEDPFS